MYQPMGGNERFVKAAAEFDARHGGNPVFVGEAKVGGAFLFKTGALRPYDELALAPGREPPQDEFERKRLIIKYYELRAQEAVKRFNKLHSDLETQARHADTYAGRPNAPMPPGEAEI